MNLKRQPSEEKNLFKMTIREKLEEIFMLLYRCDISINEAIDKIELLIQKNKDVQ